MEKTEISYNEIFKNAKDYLINDPELYLNEQDVYPSASISRNLRMDEATEIQLIKYVEEKLNVQIDEDKILNRNLVNLHQLCLALYFHVNGKELPKQPTLWQRIKQKFVKGR